MTKQIKFGTDGIRGKADQFPFTDKSLNKLGFAIAKWCINKYENRKPQILIGHDTRYSCKRIKSSLISGLKNFDVNVIDAGVLPTPAIYQLIKLNNCDLGIVISASHNPYTDNGIKLFDHQKGKLSNEDETIIANNYESKETFNVTAEYKTSEKTFEIKKYNEQYIETIVKSFPKDLLSNLKIVLDCANGATYKVAPIIFEKLGAKIIVLSASPNGKNINKNCGALYPEQLKNSVLNNKAHAGFAFDGDGDRVLSVSKSGQIKDGDDLLAILIEHPDYSKSKTIVGTIMSNHGLDIHLKKIGKNLIRTKVGDKFVSERIESENLLIGGENSGHIILNNYLNTGDGIFAAIKTIESMIINDNLEMTTFHKYPQILINTAVTNKKDLSLPPFCDIIREHEKKITNGRTIVRYSGTENLLRVMVEDANSHMTKLTAENLSKDLTAALN